MKLHRLWRRLRRRLRRHPPSSGNWPERCHSDAVRWLWRVVHGQWPSCGVALSSDEERKGTRRLFQNWRSFNLATWLSKSPRKKQKHEVRKTFGKAHRTCQERAKNMLLFDAAREILGVGQAGGQQPGQGSISRWGVEATEATGTRRRSHSGVTACSTETVGRIGRSCDCLQFNAATGLHLLCSAQIDKIVPWWSCIGRVRSDKHKATDLDCWLEQGYRFLSWLKRLVNAVKWISLTLRTGTALFVCEKHSVHRRHCVLCPALC